MADIKRWQVLEPYLKIDCSLGEAPYYEAATNHLRFVDIVKLKLHDVDLSKGASSLVSLELESSVGVTADIQGSDDELIVGAKYGYALMERKTGRLKYVKKVWNPQEAAEKEKRLRSNDGAVDSQGRFWVGMMNDPKFVDSPTNEGALFRLDPDMTLHRLMEGITIPNGIGWSPSDEIMYFTDSSTRNIFMYDFNAATATFSNKGVFFHVDESHGDAPDGLAIDVEGNIWTAVFGGGKVLRVNPHGKIIGEITLPTRCITCPTFVGEELFITSAEEEDPEAHPTSVKYAGSLFRVNVGVTGLPVNKFRRA